MKILRAKKQKKTPGGFPVLNVDPCYKPIGPKPSGPWRSFSPSDCDDYESLWSQRQREEENERSRRGGAGL
jgi:hypothetical protein